jgi:polyisoprenoid-binding protein YceI
MSRFVFTLITLMTALAMAATAVAQAGTWQIDSKHTAAQFSVKHLGVSTVRGAFTKVSGTATYDASDPSKDSLDVTIDPSSIDTRVEMRDNDLKSAHFFDVQKFPTLTFKSKSAKSAGGKLLITGDLTMHGVSKEVVLEVDGPSSPIKDPMGPGQRMGASATAKVNRQDFGISGAPGIVGDDITITIDAELTQAAAK